MLMLDNIIAKTFSEAVLYKIGLAYLGTAPGWRSFFMQEKIIIGMSFDGI